MSYLDGDYDYSEDEDDSGEVVLSSTERLISECPRGGCLFCDRSLSLESGIHRVGDLSTLILRDMCDADFRKQRRDKDVARWAHLPKPKYDEHLRSAFWKHVGRAVRRRQHCCEACGKIRLEEPFHLHHKTYDRLGNEHPDDLELLCPRCHAAEHGREIA